MKPVISREQARAFDAHVIEQLKVPGLVLMENAGRGAADHISSHVLERPVKGARAVLVCGTGNNGGDGFVIARHLLVRGATVRVFRVGFAARLTGDARIAYDAFVGIGGAVGDLTTETDLASLRDALASADVVVDAIFGTGLDRAIGGRTVDILKKMSEVHGKRVAVDIPSGLDANTGATLGASFVADVTLTFGHHKMGLLTPGGARVAGVVHLIDLGVPPALPSGDPSAELLERHDVARMITPRAVDAQKHSAGHVAVFGGSEGKVGAPLMVARGALRSGAGLVTVASWEECQAALHARVREEMSASLTRSDVASSVASALGGKRVVVVGPGLGTDEDASAVVRNIVDAWKGPVVFDADALTLSAGSPDAFAATTTRAVLTPHSGELARLLGITSAAVEADRFAAAKDLAASARSVVVLKGPSTLIVDPSGRVVVNSTGNAALATAGSGDTLGGILAAFLCMLDPFAAACAAVYVHGMAADTWSAQNGDRGSARFRDRGPRSPRPRGVVARTHARARGTRRGELVAPIGLNCAGSRAFGAWHRGCCSPPRRFAIMTVSSHALSRRVRAPLLAHDANAVKRGLLAMVPELLVRARRLVVDLSRADDLVQDAIERALRFEAQYVRGTNLRAWVYQILFSVFVTRYRRLRRERNALRALATDPCAWTLPESFAFLVARAPLMERTRQELDALPEGFRAVVVLVDLEGSSYREAASELGLPVGTVMSRLHRARKQLAGRLAENDAA